MRSPIRLRRRAVAVVVAATIGLALPGCADGEDPTALTDGETAAPDGAVTEDAAGDGAATTAPTAEPTFGTSADEWPTATVELTGTDGSTALVRVRVAGTPEQRRQGLMRVESLPDDTGMLFDFGGEEREGGFWMRDTPVPLDIAYIRDGEVVSILQMEPCTDYDDPMECPTYAPDEPYDTALEVPQGWFEAQGITVGAQVEVSPAA